MTSSPSTVDEELRRVLVSSCKGVGVHAAKGRVATYIPALARVDPTRFGVAVRRTSGAHATERDAEERFSIQSVSKVFTLSMVLRRVGARLWTRMGREPSGSPFNSIVQLEHERGIPRNPFINAGAIVLCDMLLDYGSVAETKAGILHLVRELAQDRTITFDKEVAASEADTGYRNAALANFMKGFDNLRHPVPDVLDVYFHQCSLAMSCSQLARAALFLAADGKDPLTGTRYLTAQQARRVCSIMLLCGHYDASGDFAFRVGLPGKSGVGGGIVAIVPNVAALAVWSPGLNRQGSSCAGTIVLEKIVRTAGWHML